MTTTEASVAASEPFQEEDRSRERAWLWRVRLLRGVLWLLVVTGPVAAGVVAFQLRSLNQEMAALRAQVAAPVAVNTSGVEGFAELAVAEFLTVGHGRSDGLEGPVKGGLPQTTSLGADEVAPGYFAVLVAAYNPASGVAFYTVGVASTDAEGWAVAANPSLVPAPPVVEAPDAAVTARDGLGDAVGLEEATEGFLSALLLGEGDIARYTAPGSTLRAVTPAPFTALEVTAAGSVPRDEDTRLVMTEVEGIDDAGAAHALAYSLLMAQREGRWEVVELLAAPPLAAPVRNG